MEKQDINIWELADLCTPWCLHVAATLDIAGRIESGTCQIADLATAAGCDAGVLHALMGHLASKGVFEEVAPGRFAITAPARQLLDPATRMSLDLEGIGGRFAHAWGTLLSFTRTGPPMRRSSDGPSSMISPRTRKSPPALTR